MRTSAKPMNAMPMPATPLPIAHQASIRRFETTVEGVEFVKNKDEHKLAS